MYRRGRAEDAPGLLSSARAEIHAGLRPHVPGTRDASQRRLRLRLPPALIMWGRLVTCGGLVIRLVLCEKIVRPLANRPQVTNPHERIGASTPTGCSVDI